MTQEQIVKQACKNILSFITNGNENRVLRQEDEVLILGDDGFGDSEELNPFYTETLASTIADWQGNKGLVHVKWLPKKRPIADASQIDPEITKLAQRVPVAIAAYSNPGERITQKETEIRFKTFVNPLLERKNTTLRVYLVAARPKLSILETYSNPEIIEKTNSLTRKVQKYLQTHSLEMMNIFTPNESECREPLQLRIPIDNMIRADLFEPTQHLWNLPSGEGYFEPKPGSANGTLIYTKGSFFDLQVPVKGKIEIKIEDGNITRFKDVDKKDGKILGYLKRYLGNLANRYLAEIGIGTFAGQTKIPWEDMIYNEIILEKREGFHWAYGSSIGMGGKHKAPVHIDHCFTYGNVYVGPELLIENGRIREKVL